MESITPVADDTRTEPDPPRIPTERERYIEGLRGLAAVLEQNEDIPLPYAGTGTDIGINFLSGDDPRGAMAAAARAFPCKWDKQVWGQKEAYFDLKGQLGALRVSLTAYREVVCKRAVVGTREVTEKVKDPEKLAEVPEIEVTREEEIVEYDCGSLLAPRPLADAEPKAVEAA
jgi:hypothetical protein